MGAGGRPRVELDEQRIYDLASVGCTDKEIAQILLCAESTLHLRYSDPLKRGRGNLRERLRKAQLDAAFGVSTKDNQPSAALLIWLGKQLLGQREIPPFEPDRAVPTLTISVSADGVKLDTRLPEIGPDDPDDEHNADDEAGAIDP